LADGEPSFSARGLLIAAGAPVGVADVVPVVIALMGMGVLASIRRDDRVCYSGAIIVALLASPILWPHYLVLLLVPLALSAPGIPAWALPVLLWASPQTSSDGAWWRISLVLGAVTGVALVTALALRGRSTQNEGTGPLREALAAR